MEYKKPKMLLLELEEEDIVTLSVGDGGEGGNVGGDDSWFD